MMGDEEEFLQDLSRQGYENIERLDIKKERTGRAYYKASRNGSVYFVKRIRERKVSAVIITDYIPHSVDLLQLIRNGDPGEAASAVPEAMREYAEWLVRVNSPDTFRTYKPAGDFPAEVPEVPGVMLMKRYWRHRCRETGSINPDSLRGKLKWGADSIAYLTGSLMNKKRSALVHGDAYASNFLWDGKSIHMIDFEKACVSDPNIEFAHLFTILAFHCRNNGIPVPAAVSGVKYFRNTGWFHERTFRTAADIFFRAGGMEDMKMML